MFLHALLLLTPQPAPPPAPAVTPQQRGYRDDRDRDRYQEDRYQDDGYDDDRPRRRRREYRSQYAYRVWTPDRGKHYVELGLEEETFWFSYRNLFRRGSGHLAAGILAGDEDELVANVRIMRYGEPDPDTPLGLGVGIALYGITADDPDFDAYAVALTGSIDYVTETAYPVRLGLEASWAPDVSTFDDADEILDLWARVEVELSTWASAFLGYRTVRVGVEDASTREIGDSVQLGVRLGW